MSTFKDRLQELQGLKRRLAVWEAIHYLVEDKFITKDGGKVSGIKIPDSGDLVPEEIIEDVLQAIGDGPIAELKTQIEDIELQEVIVITEKKANA